MHSVSLLDDRPSHPYIAGTQHVGSFTVQADIGERGDLI